tara:strand:- start:79 stop:516 length:438 start_codon:yes stop_codon:yes gene_type:complete
MDEPNTRHIYVNKCIVLAERLPQKAYTSIRGKPYLQVHHRIKIFRQVFGMRGCIHNEILWSNDKEVCVKSSIYYVTMSNQYILLATGHAQEFKTGNINTYSAIENGETSAVGRALGSLGIIGTGVALASAEEMVIYNNKTQTRKQ